MGAAGAPADPQVLRAAADHILELHEAGDRDAARDACAALEARAGGAHDGFADEVVRESVFTARFQRAVMDAEDGDLEAALAGYLSAAALPVDPDDPDQTHELAMALLNAGICWAAGGDPAGAIATYDDLLERVGDATDPVTAAQVTKARVNRAVAMLELGHVEDAVAAADDVLERLGPSPDPRGAEQRGMALRLRAQALRDLGRLEEAATTLADADALGRVDDPAARTQAVAAAGERAELLAALGRTGEAIELLEATTTRFADDDAVGEMVVDLRRAEVELLEREGRPDRAAEVRARS